MREDMPSGLGLVPKSFGIVTLHRPSNVDSSDSLGTIVNVLHNLSSRLPLVFPLHPRTKKMLERFNLWGKIQSIKKLLVIEPVGYKEFMSLVLSAKFVLTDSGGIQEETTYLGIPCLTLRDNTERPITVTEGTNRLVKPQEISPAVTDILDGRWKKGICPKFWDGHTALRILQSLERRFKNDI